MTTAALAILLPLLAAAAILLLRRVPASLAVAGSGLGLAAASLTLARVSAGARYEAMLPGLPEFPLRLVAEPLTALLSTMVAVVGLLVMVYAVGYMKDDAGKVRFYAGMSFFIAAMQVLVLAGDWVLLLASWEMIGLASYLLIGHYSGREKGNEGAASAATRAFLYTRTADLGLYVAIFVLVTQAGTTGIPATLQTDGPAAVVAGLLLLVAAAGKSAQTPLSGWLGDAMAGPTPVSALLHSATLVAAGAILLIRTSPLLPESVLLVAGLLGGVTIIAAGLTAVAERDLKRLLAASTSSQYGFMLLAVGAGSPVAAVLHLVAHAAMKSSLFLGAGVFQHARSSTEFGRLGGVGPEHRLVFYGFVISGLALAGVPPLSGFFSKDAIIAASFNSPYAVLFGPVSLLGTLLTGIYIARALRLLWKSEKRGEGETVTGLRWMGVAFTALVALASTVGFALGPLGSRLLGDELPEGLFVAVLGLLTALAGLALGWFVPAARLLGPARELAGAGFRIGGGFDGLVARPALALARALDAFDRRVHTGVISVGRGAVGVALASRTADERGIDGLIAALVRGTRSLGARARLLQSGLVHREIVFAVVGGAAILVFAAAAAALGASGS
ncbi:NADH-quinone oxidoreductase subunit L [Rubrobacter indicoceani]|uniref:NADH-quinone oxidoreductase subunit 5 family protein n=1 Tax=Rubrobacter indicoceani TaxID=2051957 RepID=UPI000E5A668B|nr:NADH-quinone oxidoreductase subunit L [Rubrobacter indicoceani]